MKHCPFCENTVKITRSRDYRKHNDNISYIIDCLEFNKTDCLVLIENLYICRKLFSVNMPFVIEKNIGMYCRENDKLMILLVHDTFADPFLTIPYPFKEEMTMEQIINKLKMMLVFK